MLSKFYKLPSKNSLIFIVLEKQSIRDETFQFVVLFVVILLKRHSVFDNCAFKAPKSRANRNKLVQ